MSLQTGQGHAPGVLWGTAKPDRRRPGPHLSPMRFACSPLRYALVEASLMQGSKGQPWGSPSSSIPGTFSSWPDGPTPPGTRRAHLGPSGCPPLFSKAKMKGGIAQKPRPQVPPPLRATLVDPRQRPPLESGLGRAAVDPHPRFLDARHGVGEAPPPRRRRGRDPGGRVRPVSGGGDRGSER